MTKEQIKKKAQEISEDFYMPDTGFNREDLYEAAMEMAKWLLQNIQIVKLHNAYNHDLFKDYRFQCLEEQKRQLLLSLKDYIKIEEELTNFGTIVKMEMKVIK